jgi:hydroxyacylglutathione hydrolase
LTVHGSELTANALQTSDEKAIRLPYAKKAGAYPEDYVFNSCPAEATLTEGRKLKLGRLTLTPFDTPGHCRGHVSFLVEGDDRTYLIGGDLVFFGGTIIAQNIPDCSIQEYSESCK